VSSTVAWSVAVLSAAALFVGSFLHTPYLAETSVITEHLPPDAAVTALYRRGRCSISFTSHDLLRVNAIDRERGVDAIAFDVFAGADAPNSRLTWIRQISAAMNESGDLSIADEFSSAVTAHRFAVGEVFAFVVSRESEFQRGAGIRGVYALAVRPTESTPVNDEQFADALDRAIRESHAADIGTLGVPLMAPPSYASGQADRRLVWAELLRIVDGSSCGRLGGRILIGGYALTPQNQQANVRGFDAAWDAFRLKLRTRYEATATDRLRVALVMFATAAATQPLRKKPFSIKQFVALIVVCASVGGALIATAGEWLAPWLDDAPQWLMPMALLCMAAIAGATIQHWIRFDAREQLKKE